MRRILSIAVATVLIIFATHVNCANSEFIVSGSDTDAVYNSMLISFELGKYEDVIITYELNTVLVSYRDADMYYRFSKAQNEMEKGSFEVAAYLFKGLGEFNNSDLWYSYAMARTNEQNRQYGEAVEFYTVSAALPETDSISRMKDCIDKLGEEEQKAAYLEAVSLFESAQQDKDKDNLLYCLGLFQSMGEYEDASDYARKCEEIITQMERSIVVAYHDSTDGVVLVWTDTEEGRTYIVTVYAGGAPTDHSGFECSQQTAELVNLIPGTRYTVTVMDSENNDVSGNCSFSTLDADRLDREDLQFKRISLTGVEKQLLEYTGQSFQELYHEKPALFVLDEDHTFNYMTLDQNIFCFMSSMEYTGDNTTTISVMSVFRSLNHGVIKTEAKDLLVDSRHFIITAELNSLLQRLAVSPNDLGTDTYQYELYIDGQICAEYTLTVEGR